MLQNSQIWPKSKAIGLPFFPKILNFQLCTNSSTNQKVPQNSQIWPKSKAIGLLFLAKIVHFQLSTNSSTNQRVPQNSQIWPKSKAKGLLFCPKIVHFQLSTNSSTNQKVPQNSQIWPKSKAIGWLFLPQIVLFQLFSRFFNFLHFPAQINKCLKTAKFCQKVRLSASYFCQKLSIPICTNSSTNQKVPQNSQIWPKRKAISFLFLPKVVHFQLSTTVFIF